MHFPLPLDSFARLIQSCTLPFAKKVQGVKVNEALVQRLEKESLQLENDIKEKEVENELLREQMLHTSHICRWR